MVINVDVLCIYVRRHVCASFKLVVYVSIVPATRNPQHNTTEEEQSSTSASKVKS